MSGMIRDLLEYTRTRLGRAIPISPRATSMEQICALAFDEIRAVHPERLFKLETSGPLDGEFDSEHGTRTQRSRCRRMANPKKSPCG